MWRGMSRCGGGGPDPGLRLRLRIPSTESQDVTKAGLHMQTYPGLPILIRRGRHLDRPRP